MECVCVNATNCLHSLILASAVLHLHSYPAQTLSHVFALCNVTHAWLCQARGQRSRRPSGLRASYDMLTRLLPDDTQAAESAHRPHFRLFVTLACGKQIKPEFSGLLQRLWPLLKHADQRLIHSKPVCYVGVWRLCLSQPSSLLRAVLGELFH